MDENTIDGMFLGEDGKLLPELRKFNWGAFFLGPIWGAANKSYITVVALLIMIPALFFSVVLILIFYHD